MQQVSLKEAQSHLPDLIDAAVGGEDVVITMDDEAVVKLVPVSKKEPRRQFGSAKGLIIISEDFDEPLEDFKEYMG